MLKKETIGAARNVVNKKKRAVCRKNKIRKKFVDTGRLKEVKKTCKSAGSKSEI